MKLLPKNYAWCSAFYDFTKAARFMWPEWSVFGHVLVIGPVGFGIFWRRDNRPKVVRSQFDPPEEPNP